MHNLAQHNAQTYGVAVRTQYRLGNCDHLPFDAVFTNGSLHEWVNPCGAFDEIWRVLKPGGKYFIAGTDPTRRDSLFPQPLGAVI
jgi:ubiquinone/menaquinone biosynthesis C-methylase UbiE